MPIDFPGSPIVDQQYSYNGILYTYTAEGVWSTTGKSTVYAPLDSPTFIGDPTAPHPAAADDDFTLATTGWARALLNSQLGSRVLIERKDIIAAVPEVVFVTGIDATYDKYEIDFSSMNGTSDQSNFYLQVSLDGGTTWVATSSYLWELDFISNDANQDHRVGSGGAWIQIQGSVNSADSTRRANGTIQFSHPSSLESVKSFRTDSYGMGANVYGSFRYSGGGAYNSVNAFNGVRLYFSPGNIARGKFALYGIM